MESLVEILSQWTCSDFANLLQPQIEFFGFTMMGLRGVKYFHEPDLDVPYDNIWIEKITRDKTSQFPFKPYSLQCAICYSQEVCFCVFISFYVLVSLAFRIEFNELTQEVLLNWKNWNI